MEAKASGAIIASLPIVVMVLVYLTSPQYISLLWTDKTWQHDADRLGDLDVARRSRHAQMINFDF